MKPNKTMLSFMKSLMLSCLLLAPGAAGRAQQTPMPRLATTSLGDQCRQCEQVDAMVAGEFAESRIGSLTVGVVSDDKLVWTKSYGNADSAMSLTANKDTIYRIGSITKMFTATIAGAASGSGKSETQ
jgi:CubicO group peptidase (beta-lactamase class C family)